MSYAVQFKTPQGKVSFLSPETTKGSAIKAGFKKMIGEFSEYYDSDLKSLNDCKKVEAYSFTSTTHRYQSDVVLVAVEEISPEEAEILTNRAEILGLWL